jgi:hypothetical protein
VFAADDFDVLLFCISWEAVLNCLIFVKRSATSRALFPSRARPLSCIKPLSFSKPLSATNSYCTRVSPNLAAMLVLCSLNVTSSGLRFEISWFAVAACFCPED